MFIFLLFGFSIIILTPQNCLITEDGKILKNNSNSLPVTVQRILWVSSSRWYCIRQLLPRPRPTVSILLPFDRVFAQFSLAVPIFRVDFSALLAVHRHFQQAPLLPAGCRRSLLNPSEIPPDWRAASATAGLYSSTAFLSSSPFPGQPPAKGQLYLASRPLES